MARDGPFKLQLAQQTKTAAEGRIPIASTRTTTARRVGWFMEGDRDLKEGPDWAVKQSKARS